MQKSKTESVLDEIVHHQVLVCPHCGRELVVAWRKAIALTWEEFQEKVRMLIISNGR